MAVTLRGRRTAYDNIAVGSATGTEHTQQAGDVTVVEMYGGGKRTSTSTGDVDHSNVAAGASVTDAVLNTPEERFQSGVTNTEENVG